MAMPTREELRSALFLKAALPLTKVIREKNPTIRRLTRNLEAVVQFQVKNSDIGAYLEFADDALQVGQGIHEEPTVAFVFGSRQSLNTFLAGGIALPVIRGIYRVDILVKVVPLLLALKILLPTANPKEPEKRALKVELLLYMVTTALSQLNKAGEPKISALVAKSPDRVYQFTVENGPAAYLRMKAGKTKAGRGVYTRRRPFVLMKFPDIEGAYQVLTQQAELVEAVSKGFVVTEGAMEYSKEIGMFMQDIEELVT